MRKITEESVQAFNDKKDFKKANTEIRVTAGSVQMLLHENLIAERTDNKLIISNCGWFTPTTKERLNALEGVSIYQKDFEWYLNDKKWDGKPIEIK